MCVDCGGLNTFFGCLTFGVLPGVSKVRVQQSFRVLWKPEMCIYERLLTTLYYGLETMMCLIDFSFYLHRSAVTLSRSLLCGRNRVTFLHCIMP